MSSLKIGTVISTPEGPNTSYFQFVVAEEGAVGKGEFVGVNQNSNLLIGIVVDIGRSNRYFEHAESVAEYEKIGTMRENFPVVDWEYSVANVRILGLFDVKNNLPMRCVFPIAPGNDVNKLEKNVLKSFLQLSEEGINLGKIEQHDLEVKFNLSKLVKKHLAILAMSGSGKSYLVGDLIEELLDRPKELGRIAVVAIDVHGEYTGFKKDKKYGAQTTIFPKEKIKVALNKMSVYDFKNLDVDLSDAQIRGLRPIIHNLVKHSAGDPPSLEMLIDEIKKSDMQDNSKFPLISKMEMLADHKIVGKFNEPMLDELVKPGCLSIIDMSDIINHRNKILIVSSIAKRIFDARKNGEKIPPTLLIVEEAHNFAGEGEGSEGGAKKILETIAREGRKFGVALCVVTQRPVRLSTTILSQCNSNIILRITNPSDLKHISESCEGIDSYMASSITTLQVGEALVVGEATRFPFFMRIRKRRTNISEKEKSLEESAIEFEKKLEEAKQIGKERDIDVQAFF